MISFIKIPTRVVSGQVGAALRRPKFIPNGIWGAGRQGGTGIGSGEL